MSGRGPLHYRLGTEGRSNTGLDMLDEEMVGDHYTVVWVQRDGVTSISICWTRALEKGRSILCRPHSHVSNQGFRTTSDKPVVLGDGTVRNSSDTRDSKAGHE